MIPALRLQLQTCAVLCALALPLPASSATPARAKAQAPTPAAKATTPPPAPAEPTLAPPAPLKLRYAILGHVGFFPYQTDGFLVWAHDGKSYDARMEVDLSVFGRRVQTSQGRIAAAGLQPLRFSDRTHSNRTVDFDYEQARVRFSEGTPPEPLAANAQDHLSVLLQVGVLIAAAPQRYPAGSEIVLPAMGIHGPETWRFTVVGNENLHLPGGEIATLKLNRPPARGDDPGADIWLAPSLGWLPARIRLSKPGGDYIDQRWRGSEAP